MTKEKEQIQQIGSQIDAKNNATLTATKGDVTLDAAKINAGNNLAINANKDIHINGLVEKESRSENGNKRNHTSRLESGSWSNSHQTETLKASELTAGKDLGLDAQGSITAQGAKLHANENVLVNAKDNINLNVQKPIMIKQSPIIMLCGEVLVVVRIKIIIINNKLVMQHN